MAQIRFSGQFENNCVSQTRAHYYRGTHPNRSAWAVSPVPFPRGTCRPSETTARYAVKKLTHTMAPPRYSPGRISVGLSPCTPNGPRKDHYYHLAGSPLRGLPTPDARPLLPMKPHSPFAPITRRGRTLVERLGGRGVVPEQIVD